MAGKTLPVVAACNRAGKDLAAVLELLDTTSRTCAGCNLERFEYWTESLAAKELGGVIRKLARIEEMLLRAQDGTAKGPDGGPLERGLEEEEEDTVGDLAR